MKTNFKKMIVLILVLIVGIVPVISSADYNTEMSTLLTGADGAEGEWKAQGTATTKVQYVMKACISIVRIVGMCIAVTLLLVVAIKYMSAAPGDKADIKKASFAYVVGAVILFGAVGILGIINEFALNNIKAN